MQNGFCPDGNSLFEQMKLGGQRPLASQLGVLYTRFAHYHVGELVPGATITYDLRANWKLVIRELGFR